MIFSSPYADVGRCLCCQICTHTFLCTCEAERKRRCCVLKSAGEDSQRHLEEPFTGAPLVHPFRHPSYHATQLRALHFAEKSRRRVHWMVAHDKVVDSAHARAADKEELRKERWLEFHDRFTSGIPGLLPLILDLPVRFTESLGKEAREMGIFKHTRGIIRGWQMPEPQEQDTAEDQAAAEAEAAEIVLRKRPVAVYIEVPTGKNNIPRVDGVPLFTLKVQVKQWSLDKEGNVKILRHGFPIVPDFGGTAHAYCGSTMPAALGDLLPWFRKPCMDDMLKGYIIKSRVREASSLLLARAYSPHLFRQGVLPGPQMLLDALTGCKTYSECKQAWKTLEKEQQKKPKSKVADWMTGQTLPCRRCSDASADGQEVWKPISSFTTETESSKVWRQTIAKGQDLICARCVHEVREAKETTMTILCDGCGRMRLRSHFEDNEIDRWEKCSPGQILCKTCSGTYPSRKDDLVRCNGLGCQKEVPEYNFIDEHLTHCRANNLVLQLQCARCWIQSPKCPRREAAAASKAKCAGCGVQKHIPEFSSTQIKYWLEKRARESMRCYECQYPRCEQCKERPMHAIPHNALIDGKYWCEYCRYPSCECGNRRANPGGKHRFKPYTCPTCEAQATDNAALLQRLAQHSRAPCRCM